MVKKNKTVPTVGDGKVPRFKSSLGLNRNRQFNTVHGIFLTFSFFLFVFILLVIGESCNNIVASNPPINQTGIDSNTSAISDIAPKPPSLSTGLLYDKTGSFENEVEKLSGSMITPLRQFYQSHPGTENLLIGFAADKSDKTLNRYIDVPLNSTLIKYERTNSWIKSEQEPGDNFALRQNEVIKRQNNESWETFITRLDAIMKTVAGTSDILNAYNRLLIGLKENPAAKKYLILSTDFKDTYLKGDLYSKIPDDITILIVGAQKNIPLEKEDQLRGLRFESLTSAINYIINN